MVVSTGSEVQTLQDVGTLRLGQRPLGCSRAVMLERPAEFWSEQTDTNAHCQGVGEPMPEKPKGATGMDKLETACECNGLGLGSSPLG